MKQEIGIRGWGRTAVGILLALGIAQNDAFAGDARDANMAGAKTTVAAAPVSPHNTITTLMIQARSQHSATRLLDGRVLVAGGQTTDGDMLSSAEIYDPTTKRWTSTTSMSGVRIAHTATLLPDGRVLVVGGQGDNFIRIAANEIYDPATAAWSTAGTLTTPRIWHTATSLADGDVLIVGGLGSDGMAIADAERYDVGSGTWSAAGTVTPARYAHSAAGLADGRVLVTGGASAANVMYGSSLLYDPAANAWTTTTGSGLRRSHTATTLADGSVLIASGYTGVVIGGALSAVLSNSAERYIPSTGQWSAAGTMGVGRIDHTATLLDDGRVLAVGGLGGAEDPTSTLLYEPALNQWRYAAPIRIRRTEHAATALADGTVLFTGGITYGVNAPRTNIAELYQPNIDLVAATLAHAGVDLPYAPVQLTTLGAVPPLKFEITAGSLPDGMTLALSGVLSGAPTADGDFNFTVRLTDDIGATASRAYQLKAGYFVTPHIIGNGSMSPTTVQTVLTGATQAFTVTPGVDRYADMGGSCAGTLASGIYTITNIQDHCSVTASFVPVAYPPDPPIIAGVTPANASARVQFSPPLNDGGQPILYYTATSTPGSFSRSCNAPCSSVIVSGLHNGTAYTFKMRATNRMGVSLESAASASVTPLPSQTIVFGAAPTVHIGFNGNVTVSGGASGNIVMLSSLTPSICSVAARVVTGIAVGTCEIAAQQDGNAAYLPAQQAVQSFSVSHRTYNVAAAGGAHGSIDPAGVLPTIHGNTRTFTVTPNAGYTAVVSSSCGGALSNASFTTAAIIADCSVNAAFVSPPGAPLIGTASAGDTSAFVTFTAPASDGGNAIHTFTATSTPDAVIAHCTAPCNGISMPGLRNGIAYTFRVAASNTIGVSPSSTPSNTVTPKAPQIIVFGAAPTVSVGGSGTVTASGGGSGNPVRFNSQTTNICTSSGSNGEIITGISAGTCVIAADQAAAAAYTAAVQTTQNISVFIKAVSPDAPVLISVLPLQGAARIAFGLPPDDGGSAIIDYTARCTPGAHSVTAIQSPIDVVGLSNHVAHRCWISARNSAGSGAASPALSVIPGADAAITSADLSITKNNGTGFVDGVAPIEYLITVSNPGPAAVIGARVEDAIGTGTDFSSATWVCSPLAGAACPSADSGSGALDVLLDLPAQSSVQILFTANAHDPLAETSVSNTVSLTPPTHIVDHNLTNNIASDGPDMRGIFRAGFE